MKKKFKVIECIGISEWYNKVRQEKKLEGLTVSTLWSLRKNMKPILEVVDNFNQFKTNLEDELKAEYFNEEKSEDTVIKNGNNQDVSVRQVKKEFLSAYQEKVQEINEKLSELVNTVESFTFSPIDVEKEVDRLGSGCTLDMDDLDILSIFEDDGQND